MDRSCSLRGGYDNYIQNLVARAEGKRSLKRRMRACEDNIKMDLEIIRYGDSTGSR